MSEPLVSVVIPTYGHPEVLTRALKSVAAQTHTNLEVIVVDDNARRPEDRARVEAIVREIGDPRIRLIQNERNLGGGLTRNEGILRAHADYISFLDDDDEYLPERIEKQLEAFRTSDLPNLALVYCQTVMMRPNGVDVWEEYRNTDRGQCVYKAMLYCLAATSQWMCRKDALLDVGCFSDLPCKQDANLLVKLLVKGYSVDYVPLILSRYHTDAGNTISSQNPEKRIRGEEAQRELCRAHYDLITPEQRREVEYSFACRLAPHYRAAGQQQKYREEMRKILRHPLRRTSLSVVKHTTLNR